jgi:hypothetical protein
MIATNVIAKKLKAAQHSKNQSVLLAPHVSKTDLQKQNPHNQQAHIARSTADKKRVTKRPDSQP